VFEEDNVDKFKFVFIKPQDINALDGEGDTLLMKAVTYGSKWIISALLSSGANPLIGDKHGNTALSIAVGKGDQEHAKQFIKLKKESTQRNCSEEFVKELEMHLENKNEPAGTFELFVAPVICKKQSDLRDLLEIDLDQALTCFTECFKTLGDSVDLSNADELD